MIDHPEHERLFRLVRQATDSVAAFATRAWGEAWRLRARAHFPGDGEKSGLLQARTLLPWSLFRWRARRAAGANGAEEEAGERLDATALFLQRHGRDIDAPLEDFLRAARTSPFRFLVANGDVAGTPRFLDSLSPRDMPVAWMPDWASVSASSVVFGQLVDMGEVAVFTHEPVPVNLCAAPAERLLAFLRQLAMAVEALGGGREEAEIIAETTLFRQAAAHVWEQPTPPCPDAAEPAAEGARLYELLFDWPRSAPEPDMESLSPHTPWVRMTREADTLKVQTPGFLPMFATFRHMLHTLPRTPRLRNVAISASPAGE